MNGTQDIYDLTAPPSRVRHVNTPVGNADAPLRLVTPSGPLANANRRPDQAPGFGRGPSNLPGTDTVADRSRGRTLAALAARVSEISRRHRGPAARRCPTGWPALDALLGGGLAGASVHEFVARKEAAAVCTVALQAAARAAGSQRWLVYIDLAGDLYAPGVAQLGVPLGRMLVVRPERAADALGACEQSLQCRAVAAVVLPLRRPLEPQTSRRLQLAAERGGGLGLLLCAPGHVGHSFAAGRLQFDPLIDGPGPPRMRITVLKQREGPAGGSVVVELTDAADSVPAPAVPGDAAGVAGCSAIA